MLLTSPLSSPLKNPVRDVFSPAGSSQSLTAQVQALFASRAGGMWDMGDTSKLFQDSATLTTPVTTAGQTIGLVLDSKNTTVDATVITNGNFSVGTGWTMPAGVSISSGALRCTAAGGYVYQNATSMTSGAVYKVTYTVSNYSGGSIKAYVNAAPVFGFTVSANGVSTGYIRAGSSSVEVGFNLTGFTGDIDDFSVCRVPGNHATQPTAGSRPAYQTNGGHNCARFSSHILSTGNIDLSASTMALVSIAFAPNTWSLGLIAEFGPNAASNNGSFYLSVGESGAGFFDLTARSTANDKVRNTSALTLSAPLVLTAYFDLAQSAAASKIQALINGASGATTVIGDPGDSSANWMNSTMNFGARAGNLVNSSCDLFAVVFRGGSATAGEIALVDQWTRSRVGL